MFLNYWLGNSVMKNISSPSPALSVKEHIFMIAKQQKCSLCLQRVKKGLFNTSFDFVLNNEAVQFHKWIIHFHKMCIASLVPATSIGGL